MADASTRPGVPPAHRHREPADLQTAGTTSAVTLNGTDITVDATLLCETFGLTEQKLRDLMRSGVITARCELGQGEDAGRTRLNFLYGNRVLRLTVDATGNPVEPARIDFTSSLLSLARSTGR